MIASHNMEQLRTYTHAHTYTHMVEPAKFGTSTNLGSPKPAKILWHQPLMYTIQTDLYNLVNCLSSTVSHSPMGAGLYSFHCTYVRMYICTDLDRMYILYIHTKTYINIRIHMYIHKYIHAKRLCACKNTMIWVLLYYTYKLATTHH